MSTVLWQPHAGPQTTFLESAADEALYGGAAGGGKSDALLFGALRQIHHPKYRALILRRTFPELRELMDRALETFGAVGGKWQAAERRWHFPNGGTVEFGYCESYADVMQYQGQQFTYIAFDEIGQLAEERIWTYLMSRNRKAAPDLRTQMRASANPGGPGHHWLKRRFVDTCTPDGALAVLTTTLPSGRVMSATRAYVPAKLKDNPTLMENDPGYEARLAQLPELEYRWLAEGDWSAGAGLALRISDAHMIRQPFPIPPHWTVFGALDWGYNHPFAYGIWAADEDGNVILCDTAHGRHLQPPEIVARAQDVAGILWPRIRYTIAGHDVWADVKARMENIPTLAEQFAACKAPMVKANISRVSGVQNLRRYLDMTRGVPRFRMFDTPGNRRVREVLETRVSDPDNVEDVLKTDADGEGRGGDDAYDMVRYALASRPAVAVPPAEDTSVKRDDRSPHFNIESRKFEMITPDRALEEALGLAGQRRGVGRHRVPVGHHSRHAMLHSIRRRGA